MAGSENFHISFVSTLTFAYIYTLKTQPYCSAAGTK